MIETICEFVINAGLLSVLALVVVVVGSLLLDCDCPECTKPMEGEIEC